MISNILLIGSGPIVIGQACEFDYSGTQAIKTLKNLGYKVILINSNPATIMTDPNFADRTYIEPITEEIIFNIIKKEKIDAILPTMGGQTALNVAMSMFNKGMLEGIKFLGANPEAIKKGEDRAIFKETMIKIGMDVPKSKYAYNEEEALNAAEEIGFPLMIRASFTLAGGGSGIAYNIEEFMDIAKNALSESPIGEILIEESLIGWKEYEMEVIRDRLDNCIIVCSIENFDPMGVHTGDSITVAPALTLTDKEYQRMRDASFKILREIGVDTGGSNVQFAINPKNGRMIVIEMNPRVSRSSALASKATGYPIAKVATMLAVGYTLEEIKNDITGMPASFEPSIDYIVTKIPRFTFEKFPFANSTLNTSMKSIGEVMAIGGSFKESLQKAICSLEHNFFGFNYMSKNLKIVKDEIRRPNENRLFYIAEAFGLGLNIDEIYELCKIDKWFLNEIKEIVELESLITNEILNDKELLRKIKSYGFSDKMIAFFLKENENIQITEEEVYQIRKDRGITPVFYEVDTCAGEFPSLTTYFYSSIGNFETIDFNIEVKEVPKNKVDKVLILGSGPNRIGQGIEFDYCCVHASFALKDLEVESIMQNCNPETVSTDYDISDKLYFEPIDFEHVRNIVELENPDGIIVHFGGQTPLKLSKNLAKINAKIIGTSPKTIDIAENREKFSKFIQKLGLNQPQNGIAYTQEEAFSIAYQIRFPILVRPSYVLGGRAMKIVYNEFELKKYMNEVISISEENPILIDKFLDGAIELDVDCVSDGYSVYIGGIMEHIEEAGIHSGDSASILPANVPLLKEIEQTSALLAIKLNIKGLINIQYAIFNNQLFIIEVNPRASRSVPFVSKATGMPLAKIATRVMWNGIKSKDVLYEALNFYDKYNTLVEIGREKKTGAIIYSHKKLNYVNIKESVFPFKKLPGADFLLGPEMKSTGEVMSISSSFGVSFAKSQIACKYILPRSGNIFISLQDRDKNYAVHLAKNFLELGFKILSTGGTHKALSKENIESKMIFKVSEGRPHVNDMIKNGEIAMVINTSQSQSDQNEDNSSIEDSKLIRRAVLKTNIPYFTTINGAMSVLKALQTTDDLNEVCALQDYLEK